MGKIVFFFLVGLVSGIVLGENEFDSPWPNLILGKESERIPCDNGREGCPKNLSFLKNDLGEPSYLNLFQANKRGQSRLLQYSNAHSCSCGMDRRIVDLGRPYFPRYVLSGQCHLKCRAGTQMCRPKHYALMVLKMKDLENDESDPSENSAPSDLKDSWTTETKNVIVSCECGS